MVFQGDLWSRGDELRKLLALTESAAPTVIRSISQTQAQKEGAVRFCSVSHPPTRSLRRRLTLPAVCAHEVVAAVARVPQQAHVLRTMSEAGLDTKWKVAIAAAAVIGYVPARLASVARTRWAPPLAARCCTLCLHTTQPVVRRELLLR